MLTKGIDVYIHDSEKYSRLVSTQWSEKQIQFEQNSEYLWVIKDTDFIDRILPNLRSNGMKFSCMIVVAIKVLRRNAGFSMIDDGLGMQRSGRERIF